MLEIMLTTPHGSLEGRYYRSQVLNAPIALVLHPHPLHGGTMNNRVTYELYRVFGEMGFSVIRYNSPGVGRSQGKFDDDGEISAAAAALDWLQTTHPYANDIWIVGYSFGAFVGMQLLMRRPEITGWVSVAPLVTRYDFSFLAPCPCSGLIIAGGMDKMAPATAIRKLVNKLNVQENIAVDYYVLNEANHIFSGHIDKITMAVKDYVTKAIMVSLTGVDVS